MDREIIINLEQTLLIAHSIKEWERVQKQEKFLPRDEICFEYEKTIGYKGTHKNNSLVVQYNLEQGSWIDDDYVSGEPMVIKHYYSYKRKYYVLSVFEGEDKVSEFSTQAFPYGQIEYNPNAQRKYSENIQEVYKIARRKAFFLRFRRILPGNK